MDISLSYKNIKPEKALEVFVNEKIGSLAKFLKGQNVLIHVEIGKNSRHHRRGDIFYAEANFNLGKKLFRADASGDDLRVAINEVKDRLQMEIKRFKEKLNDSKKKGPATI